MSVDNIEKIELLMSFFVKYEVVGSGGLINIVLKKYEGFGINGLLFVFGGYGEGEKVMVSMRINYSVGFIYVFVSYIFLLDEIGDGFYGVGINIVLIFGG